MPNEGKFYESEYEESFLLLLQAASWRYTPGEELHRQYTDPLIEDDLREYLAVRYKGCELTAAETAGVVARLRNSGGQNDYEALRNTFRLYRDGYIFTYSDNRSKPFQLQYIDFDAPDHNIFRCVNQFVMEQGRETRRPDILLFVNGIPVCIIELKNPTDLRADIHEAYAQICTRYVRDIPSLLKYSALAVISDGAKNCQGTPFTPFEYFNEWKKVDNDDSPGIGLDTAKTLIRGALSPERILEILRDYIYFPDRDTPGTLAVVCRYPQFFAVRKLRDYVLRHLRSVREGDGKGGTYFGATGCGKTYTMLFLARQLMLRCGDTLSRPTILIIVDREDLENQSAKVFCRSKEYIGDNEIRIFETRDDLAREMTARTAGGVYITTIQKFTSETGTLTDRANVICMSDEAHRTQNNIGSNLSIRTEGDADQIGAKVTYGFAKYLRAALPNATYVGFTGTPIEETIHVFGEVVDRYTMLQSEQDGITVPIRYDPRMAKAFTNEDRVKEVEEYYAKCAEEGSTEEEIAASMAAMSSLEQIIGNEDVLRRVAEDIIKDYKVRIGQTDRVQKAMITCPNREIAYRLYKVMREREPGWFEAKKTLGDERTLTRDEQESLHDVAFVNMVMTRGDNDERELYTLLGDKEHRRFLENEYKSERSNFHISINVDMWITGFDVPCLTYLYNDKPLQKHTLIQTISRVNRRFGSKECGVIIDYIGIRKELQKAMKQYGGDKDGGNGASVNDVEAAHTALLHELDELKGMTESIDFAPFFADNALARLCFLQKAAEFILSRTVQRKGEISFLTAFTGHVKRLRSAYNICNPAGRLSNEESDWCQCFMGICSFVTKIAEPQHNVKSMNKDVEAMVQEAIKANEVVNLLRDEGRETDIFGEEFQREIDALREPYTKFQLLCKLLGKAIKEYGRQNKIQAEHFSKLLKKTVEEYNSRDPLTDDNVKPGTEAPSDTLSAGVVDTLTKRLQDILCALKTETVKFKELGITFEEKAFADILIEVRNEHNADYNDAQCILLATKMKLLIDNIVIYADWLNNDNLKNKIAFQLSCLLYKEGFPQECADEVYEKVMEQMESYKMSD